MLQAIFVGLRVAGTAVGAALIAKECLDECKKWASGERDNLERLAHQLYQSSKEGRVSFGEHRAFALRELAGRAGRLDVFYSASAGKSLLSINEGPTFHYSHAAFQHGQLAEWWRLLDDLGQYRVNVLQPSYPLFLRTVIDQKVPFTDAIDLVKKHGGRKGAQLAAQAGSTLAPPQLRLAVSAAAKGAEIAARRNGEAAASLIEPRRHCWPYNAM
jgi:hypothetical protein